MTDPEEVEFDPPMTAADLSLFCKLNVAAWLAMLALVGVLLKLAGVL